MSRPPAALRLALAPSVLFLIVAATAVPIQFRSPRLDDVTFTSHDLADIAANVLLYVPLGLALGRRRPLRAVLAGAALSLAAEAGQLFMLHRDPSLVDVLTNIAGTGAGAAWVSRRRREWRPLRLGRWMAVPGVLVAAVPVVYLQAQAALPLNPRGVSQPGALEAAWRFDEEEGRAVADAAGHGIDGRFRREPGHVPWIRGTAAVLEDGNYVRVPSSTALRIQGSMTITAWVNSHEFPGDDAAILSQLRVDRGYQLDTTVDTGSRTIGYKLTDSCGRLMARYGATPLERDVWYHVAGVYDARARTLHVYLNGELDDGARVGSVSGYQLSARGPVYLGARANSRSFPFTGALDDVRVYSFALTPAQIRIVMQGMPVDAPAKGSGGRAPAVESRQCAMLTDKEDKDLPFAAALTGMALALSIAVLAPARRRILPPAAGLIAGMLLAFAFGGGLPAFNLWTIPLTAAAGAVLVSVSVRDDDERLRTAALDPAAPEA